MFVHLIRFLFLINVSLCDVSPSRNTARQLSQLCNGTLFDRIIVGDNDFKLYLGFPHHWNWMEFGAIYCGYRFHFYHHLCIFGCLCGVAQNEHFGNLKKKNSTMKYLSVLSHCPTSLTTTPLQVIIFLVWNVLTGIAIFVMALVLTFQSMECKQIYVLHLAVFS